MRCDAKKGLSVICFSRPRCRDSGHAGHDAYEMCLMGVEHVLGIIGQGLRAL